MTPDKTARERANRSLTSSFERYLQDKGKGRGGDGGNYRRNAARELDRFAEWTAGDRGRDDWTGIVPDDVVREPTFEDLDERVFREYARHLAGDRGLKQNTVQTYYRYISAWCGWCVNEGYLEAHYAQRASATTPLPEDDGRKPEVQQAWTSERRHALTRYVDEKARMAIEQFTGLPKDVDEVEREQARYSALRAARDRALVCVLAYTAVRVGELLRDPDDSRRRGIRWQEINLEDGSKHVYQKKQQWDSARLPDPVISPLRNYRRLLDPPSERWPIFPTFDQRTLATLVKGNLVDQGMKPKEIDRRRDAYARDLLLALAEDIHPSSMTTAGVRSILKRVTTEAEIDVDHPKHDI